MSDPPPIGRSSRTWQYRLWHLAVGVLVVALLFGLVHAARSENPEARKFGFSILIPLFGIIGVAILATPPVFAFQRYDVIVRGLLDQGERRGGLIGFATPSLVVLLWIFIGLVATVFGFVAMSAWFMLLFALVGFD